LWLPSQCFARMDHWKLLPRPPCIQSWSLSSESESDRRIRCANLFISSVAILASCQQLTKGTVARLPIEGSAWSSNWIVKAWRTMVATRQTIISQNSNLWLSVRCLRFGSL
jgi:hypothetical protein